MRSGLCWEDFEWGKHFRKGGKIENSWSCHKVWAQDLLTQYLYLWLLLPAFFFFSFFSPLLSASSGNSRRARTPCPQGWKRPNTKPSPCRQVPVCSVFTDPRTVLTGLDNKDNHITKFETELHLKVSEILKCFLLDFHFGRRHPQWGLTLNLLHLD